MDWWLLPLFLWLCVTQGASESTDERFYLRLAKNDDDTLDLTLQQCKKSECLRRGDHELGDIQCMCGDRYIEAERVRAECGDDGRNETAVEVLERQNLPEKLGICARAFAKLGYVVEAVKSNGSADDVRTYNDSELETKISEVTVFAREFWSLLDRTLVGVYLSSDQQRNICKDAYNEWLCSISLSFYSVNDSEVKPCLSVCTRVVQQCPYYLPSKFQDNAGDEIIYGGYPVFDCPDVRILREYDKRKESCVNMSCQAIPYGLEQDCIGRDGATIDSSEMLVLFLSILWVLV